MTHVVASIQARMGSTRLPGKVLLSIGEKRVLEWAVDRCKSSTSVDETVVTIGDQPENTAITEWCDRNNCKYIIEKEDDLLARHYRVSKEYDADAIIRVTADCPFIPPTEISRVVDKHEAEAAEYTTNWTGNTPIGVTVCVLENHVLERLHRQGETHPITPVRNSPDRWSICHTDSDEWTQYSDVHLAVDEPNDYWRLADAYQSVGSEALEIAEWMANK